jgi:hypothetical protein
MRQGQASLGKEQDMNFVALKMLVADRAKYFGLIFAIAFASLSSGKSDGHLLGHHEPPRQPD